MPLLAAVENWLRLGADLFGAIRDGQIDPENTSAVEYEAQVERFLNER